MLRAVIEALREYRGSGVTANAQAGGLFAAVTQQREILGEQCGEDGRLRREQGGERIMGGAGNRGVDRGIFARTRQPGIAVIITGDRIDGVEHRDVDDCHRATGAARSDLFAEDTVLAWRNRRVVEATGIDRDLIPVAQAFHGRGQ